MDFHANSMSDQRKANGLAGRLAIVPYVILAGLFLALLGRLLSYPLNRDENLFLTAGKLLGTGDLYRDLGFNHLPNFAYLLSGVFRLTGTEHLLLAGRLVILAAWIGIFAALWLISLRTRAGFSAFFVAAIFMAGNAILLGQAGMLVSNNIMPLPLSLFAFYFLLGAIDGIRPSMLNAFLAGVFASLAIGFKANYVFIAPIFALAVLLAPAARSWPERLIYGVIPLAIGGLLAGLPAIAHFVLDPEGFTEHTIRYFTELHAAYWADSTEPKIVTVARKVLLAEEVWLSGTFLLVLTGNAILLAILALSRGTRQFLQTLLDWKLVTGFGLILCAVVMAYVPAVSISQYLVPPLPFLVLLFILLYARLEQGEARTAAPAMLALAILGLLASSIRLAPGLVQLIRPGSWDVLSINREVGEMAERGGVEPSARVATLTPALALEAGMNIYPEFAAGQFVYRVTGYMTPETRQFYRTTTPDDLADFLDANPPDAIFVNQEEELEQAFADYARSRGYREIAPARSKRPILLFVRPD